MFCSPAPSKWMCVMWYNAAVSTSHQASPLVSGSKQKFGQLAVVKFTTASRAEQLLLGLDLASAYVLFSSTTGRSEIYNHRIHKNQTFSQFLHQIMQTWIDGSTLSNCTNFISLSSFVKSFITSMGKMSTELIFLINFF